MLPGWDRHGIDHVVDAVVWKKFPVEYVDFLMSMNLSCFERLESTNLFPCKKTISSCIFEKERMRDEFQLAMLVSRRFLDGIA